MRIVRLILTVKLSEESVTIPSDLTDVYTVFSTTGVTKNRLNRSQLDTVVMASPLLAPVDVEMREDEMNQEESDHLSQIEDFESLIAASSGNAEPGSPRKEPMTTSDQF